LVLQQADLAQYEYEGQYGKKGSGVDVVYMKNGKATREISPPCKVATEATFPTLDLGGRAMVSS
jgi:hypothetical protein